MGSAPRSVAACAEIIGGGRTTIPTVPLYEFACRSCGHRFEELTGSHVGVDAASVSCPRCGASEPKRLVSGYATARGLTPSQKRRLEEKRGIDRDGARQRFKRRRAAERRARGSGDG